jgi:ribonuclease E
LEEPVVVRAEAPEPVAVQAQPLAAPPQPAQPIAPVELPKAELEQILAGAGLQWVETVARPAAAEAPAEVPPPRAPRTRRPRSAPVSEPLQQVETRSGGEG